MTSRDNTTSGSSSFWNKTTTTATTDAAACEHGLTKSSSLSWTEQKPLQVFEDSGGRRRGAREELWHFCSETSFTALVRIYKASSWARRLGWLVVVLSMLCWLMVQCYWLLSTYLSYPMEVKIEMEAATQLEFPSVTVCNLNPLRLGQLHKPSFRPLARVTSLLDNDDVLYHYYYNNYQSMHSSSSEFRSSILPSATPSTTPGTGEQRQSEGEMRGERGKVVGGQRIETGDTEVRIGTEPIWVDFSYMILPVESRDPNMTQLVVMDVTEDAEVSQAAKAEDGLQEAAWARLEREIFDGQEVWLGGAQRQRRSADTSSNERLEAMRNNSFNKWDALDSPGINVSYYQTRGVEFQAAMAYASLSATLPPDRVKRSGHHLHDFLITCRYDGFRCSPRNFSYFHNHKYGNCYTFNSEDTAASRLYTRSPGPQHGLTLELFLQQQEYVAALAAEAGVRVVVHPKGTAVFPEDDGVSIPPAHSTSVGISMEKIERLGPPHGCCDDQKQAEDLYAVHWNLTYRKLSCLKSCYQTIVRSFCNCSLPMYFLDDDRDHVCDMTVDETADDRLASRDWFQGGSLSDDRVVSSLAFRNDGGDRTCPGTVTTCTSRSRLSLDANRENECEDQWRRGTERLTKELKEIDGDVRYLQTKIRQSSYLLMDGDVRSNDFAKLNVYFTDLIYTKVEQQRAFEFQNLVSDIGGQLGLWLGLSAITIGELCGLLLSLFRLLTARGPRERSVTTSTTTPVQPFSTALQRQDDDHEGFGEQKGHSTL
ncbi:epithelial sodium channel subunit gamma-like [Babylonia areolata]|uniref:epithelial sodium channel subunit gamma-like n=1 Tax=Babylonia areolata TaxID=304850 RepID=UPI003FD19307